MTPFRFVYRTRERAKCNAAAHMVAATMALLLLTVRIGFWAFDLSGYAAAVGWILTGFVGVLGIVTCVLVFIFGEEKVNLSLPWMRTVEHRLDFELASDGTVRGATPELLVEHDIDLAVFRRAAVQAATDHQERLKDAQATLDAIRECTCLKEE